MTVSNASPTVWFITGANRGIGLGIVQLLAQRPDTIVIATTRNPAEALELAELAQTHTNVHIVKLEVTSDADHIKALEDIARIAPTGVDVLLANAGVNPMPPALALDVPLSQVQAAFDVNTLGPLRAFHTLYPLLKMKTTRKVFFTSSEMGTFDKLPMAMFPTFAYNLSKLAARYTAMEIARDLKGEEFTVIPIHPGWVATEMGNKGAKLFDLEQAPVSILESAGGIIKTIEAATTQDSGRFLNWKGEEVPL
ncbi:toxin biosynthesis ketoreductase [Fimicolochytrium jonesii]|uniref:toxin biosynthesis ketoreductase n=1 Tax=Fimicolochytrium jonesii TaxID=1396493 RepID=UPI0022FEC94D|nr:toxin biosynthesis ketoreductase [Fimicolochytrium jonesii]KAI8824546.1 toxin biosynthesis ketoreductase [Fimicolochytrium jonesii]